MALRTFMEHATYTHSIQATGTQRLATGSCGQHGEGHTMHEFERGVRAALESLEGKGYRDPLGRPAEVHLAIMFFGAKEYEHYPDDVAYSLDEMESTGTL
jgi:hypothetical protein